MMKKNKSQPGSLSELHCISSQSLEQSVSIVTRLADKHHRIQIQSITEDEYLFQIDYVPRFLVRATIQGNLQRWNGTETKVEANGITGFTIPSQESKWANRVHMIVMILSSLLIIVSFFMIHVIWGILFGILVAICSFIVGRILNKLLFGLHFYPFKDPSLIGFNSRYPIFHKIYNEFQMAGDIEKTLKV